MNRAKNSGFTIVESLIVLGVSGMLFVSMAILVSGQQSKARFRSAMSDVTTQIQQTINEVGSGHYPSLGNFTCSASGIPPVVGISPGGSSQGTNANCTFLGRAMMFGIPSTDPEEYRIHTIVGLRQTATGGQPATLQEAGARALAPGLSYSTGFPDTSTQKSLQYGMTLAWMKNGIGEAISGFAVVYDPSNQVSYSAGGSVLESGTVIPAIFPISHISTSPPTPGLEPAPGVDMIARSIGVVGDTAETSPSEGPIQLCFRSGTTNQSGLITVGAANSTTSIDFLVFNSVDCT